MYKYHGSIFELMVWLKKFRRLYEEVAISEISNLVGGCFRPTDDKQEYDLWTKDGYFNFSELTRLLQDEIRRGLDEPFNINASVIIYPYKDQVYVQFFGLRFGLGRYSKRLQEHIDGNERFSDYSYWDNSDPPNDVGLPTWNRRGEFFEEIFNKHTSFNSCYYQY